MWTPLILFALLVTPYAITRMSDVSVQRRELAGVVGVCSVFLFTGIGHFVDTEAMAQMLPPEVPMRTLWIQVSGGLEIALALGLLIPGLRHWVGWLLIWMLAGLLPFDIYAAFMRVPMGGHAWGPIFLGIQVPLRLLLMAWIYRFATRPRQPRTAIEVEESPPPTKLEPPAGPDK